MRCLRGEHWYWVSDGGVWIDKKWWLAYASLQDARGDVRTTSIPLRPIFAGFTINTFFYTTILWLLIAGPFVLRRFLRAHRGLCPKCAYPMGEAVVCSECGGELPRRVRVGT